MVAWEEAHRFGVDVSLTVVVALLFGVISASTAAYGSAPEGLTALLAVAVLVPLAWRRTRPNSSAIAVYGISLVEMVVLGTISPAMVAAVLFALYSVTVHGRRWAHRTAIVGALVGSALALGPGLGLRDLSQYVAAWMFMAAVALATWAFGLVRRSRRETIEALVDRAQRLEVERDQQARIATAAERARIAREMHDIVAHSLTVMIAQADGGRYAGAADPGAATRALETIGETGRAALADMRRLLGVLRTETGDDGEGPATAPQPAAADVGALVDQMRDAGMRVSLVRLGEPRALPPGMGATAFRITQEALTNVLKHAGPDPEVTVMLQWLPASVVLEITDDGRGASADADGLGQGLLGMGERATMFGGTVTAGPRPGGGFRVRAMLPTPGDRPAASVLLAPGSRADAAGDSHRPTDQEDR